MLRNEPHGDWNFSNTDRLQNPSFGYLLMVLTISKLERIRETEVKRLTPAQSMVTQNQTQSCNSFQIQAKNTKCGHTEKINRRNQPENIMCQYRKRLKLQSTSSPDLKTLHMQKYSQVSSLNMM